MGPIIFFISHAPFSLLPSLSMSMIPIFPDTDALPIIPPSLPSTFSQPSCFNHWNDCHIALFYFGISFLLPRQMQLFLPSSLCLQVYSSSSLSHALHCSSQSSIKYDLMITPLCSISFTCYRIKSKLVGHDIWGHSWSPMCIYEDLTIK